MSSAQFKTSNTLNKQSFKNHSYRNTFTEDDAVEQIENPKFETEIDQNEESGINENPKSVFIKPLKTTSHLATQGKGFFK